MILNDTQSLGGTEGSQSGVATAKLQEDLNRFLNLLVTQLKNQDPLDPMDANEFTSQLVSFANVERQIHQNASLEELIKLQQTSQIAAIVDYLGTRVEATTKHTVLEDGAAEFTYSMDENVSDVTINIKDSSGTTVFVGDGEPSAGKHGFVWDGLGFGGMPQPEGTYTVSVTALGRDGSLLPVAQTAFGRVTGASTEDGAITLFFGNVVVPFENVISVTQ